MKEKLLNLILILIAVIVVSLQLTTLPGCANMMPPEGGRRDSLPPLLLKATPPDSSKQFHSNKISLTFDEFVQLDNWRQNLIVSPMPTHESDINVESKLRTLTVTFKDSLKPNTTYTLNFGNSIKDYNEGNILRNFTYVFSTGNNFDSLTLSGNVLLAENGKIDTTLMVMLHKDSQDSAVVNERPSYVARLDASGHFHFRNLPAGVFYLYALKNESNYRYSEKSLFAFADKPINTSDTNQGIVLYAYTEKASASSPFANLNIPVGRGGARTTDKRLKIQTNIVNNQLDLLNDFMMSFEQPLKTIDTGKIFFSRDSAYNPVVSHKLTLDSSHKKLTLHTTWNENTLYHLVLNKDFAEDSSARKLLKDDTITFKTRKLSEYGSLRIRFKNLDLSKNPVLLFVQSDNVVRSESLTSADVSFPLFLPGDYDLRILYDRNKNGKWDPGQFFGKHIQPEIVTPITSRPRITVKGNWQNEFDIAL
jgi:Big-like domain-containing protein